jgi:acetyltransferase-like isoleucine patch superfamily enzyme
MQRSLTRQVVNRIFHFLARHLPGSTGLRPLLHRLRGVRVGRNVFIGDEVYLENEYPEAVEIQDGVQISVRAIIIAHTRGSGHVIIEKDAFIGPNAVIVTSGGRPLRIGEGAVIGAGVVITNNVASHMLVVNNTAKIVAKASIPLTRAEKVEDFVRGLLPIRGQSQPQSKKK